MSRAYRISVSESVTRVVHVEDGVETALELLPVLAPEQMQELLAAELAKRGFTRVEGEGVMVRIEDDGVVIEVELASGKVNVSLGEESEVDAKAQRTATTAREDQQDAIREGLKGKVAADLEAEVERKAEQVRQEVTKRLEKRLGDLRQELDQVVNGTTATALKQRAAQLGEIEEVHENAESGELTIRVKV